MVHGHLSSWNHPKPSRSIHKFLLVCSCWIMNNVLLSLRIQISKYWNSFNQCFLIVNISIILYQSYISLPVQYPLYLLIYSSTPSPAKQHWLGFKEKYWAKEVKGDCLNVNTRANMYNVQCILVLKYDQSRAAKVQVVSRLQQQTDTRPGGWGPVTCSRSRAI